EKTALALVGKVLGLFQTRLESLGSSIFDAKTLALVKTTLSTIQNLESKSTIPADEFLEFLSQNLLGIPSNFLDDANNQLHSALAILDPFSGAALELRIAARSEERRVGKEGRSRWVAQ